MAKPWADAPYPLLSSPRANLGNKSESGASTFATEMVHAHNIFIRGLNSMTHQAINVTEVRDVKDFVLYVETWVKNLHDHHATEEEVVFPLIEDETGVDGIMDPNLVQHEAFGPGVDALSEYVGAVSQGKAEYDGRKIVNLIADFATILTAHLKDEINTLLSLEIYDTDWAQCNKRMTDRAIESLDWHLDIGFVMTHSDSTFEGGIHKDAWPPFLWSQEVLGVAASRSFGKFRGSLLILIMETHRWNNGLSLGIDFYGDPLSNLG